MKKNILIMITLVLSVFSCSTADLYGRSKDVIYSIEGPFDKAEVKEVKEVKEFKIEPKVVNLPVAEEKIKTIEPTPIVPIVNKNVKIISAEEYIKNKKPKLEEKVAPSEKKEFKYTKEDYKDLKLNEDDEKILKLFKSYYKIIEPYDVMLLKTKEVVYKIQNLQDPNVNSTVILKEIHEMIKETKTKSFILAVNRVEKNRGLK